MGARKVQVKENDTVIISCPCCGKTKELSVERFKQNYRRDLRVKCICQKIFHLCLEFRKDFRKSVKLLGKSTNLSNHGESHDIIIKNISIGGLGFTPFKNHKIKKDDRLLLSFELNDYNNTRIDTDAVVRTVKHDYIGCEFNNKQKIESSYGFYFF